LPIALVRELCSQGTNDLHIVGWGGGIPLELLLEGNQVSKFSFCFSSLDIFGLAPRFRKALETDSIEVVEYSALALINAFEAAGKNLPYQTFKTPTCDPLPGFEIVTSDLDDYSVSKTAALPVDYLLLHAQEADVNGNVILRGSRGIDPSIISAAKNIIVTVEKIVEKIEFTNNTLIIPFTQVNSIIELPFAAYPTSCLPHYISDYGAIEKFVSNNLDVDYLNLTEKRKVAIIAPVELSSAAIMESIAKFDNGEDSRNNEIQVEDLMICTLSRLYKSAEVLTAGAVSPLAQGSYFLAKVKFPEIVIMTTAGGLIDVASRPLLLGLGELLDYRSAINHTGGDDTYHVYYEPGDIDYEVVSCAQIDRHGRANNFWVTSPSGKRIRLPGQGGMADVSDLHANFVVYQMSQDEKSFVDEVEYVSAQRILFTDSERKKAGLRPGKVLYLSNKGFYQYDPETDLLELKIEFAIDDPNFLRKFQQDFADELKILRKDVDPLGIRFLESTKGDSRKELLRTIIDLEDSIIQSATKSKAG
jgi:glutaconate CoA-transferase subunit A